ncbi:hypothetical protein N0Y54_33880 [Nostoc punctiforme UO1]
MDSNSALAISKIVESSLLDNFLTVCLPHLLNIHNMNIDRLHELKQKLTNDADLSDIWLFYMDHFADLPEFTDLGEPAYNEYLVVRQVNLAG